MDRYFISIEIIICSFVSSKVFYNNSMVITNCLCLQLFMFPIKNGLFQVCFFNLQDENGSLRVTSIDCIMHKSQTVTYSQHAGICIALHT